MIEVARLPQQRDRPEHLFAVRRRGLRDVGERSRRIEEARTRQALPADEQPRPGRDRAPAPAGARLLVGGQRLPGPGFFDAPTALADIPKSAPAYGEEVFGPVALLFRARDLDHAIALANDSPFGLGSSVWTNDPHERGRFIDELEAGMTFVNAMVASDSVFALRRRQALGLRSRARR